MTVAQGNVGPALMPLAVGLLLVFAPGLERAKRTALREYGTLAHGYVRAFDDKWLRGGAACGQGDDGRGQDVHFAGVQRSGQSVSHWGSPLIWQFLRESLLVVPAALG